MTHSLILPQKNAPEGKITMGNHGSLVSFQGADISGEQVAGRDAISGHFYTKRRNGLRFFQSV
jgi:hypothetical protein